MKLKFLYFFGPFAIVTTGIFFILRFGYEPAPVRVMKPSFFDQPEEIGATLYRRFYSPIEQYRTLVFGIPPQPEHYRAIVRGLLKAAAAEKHPFEAIVMEAEMPKLDLTDIPPMETFVIGSNTRAQAELIDRLAALKKENKRTLFYTASVFSSHLLNGNAIVRYEQQTGNRLLAITATVLSLNPQQEVLVDPPCVGAERDGMGTAALGCAVLRSSRGVYRKEFPKNRYIGMMISPVPEDYLLMVAVPGQ